MSILKDAGKTIVDNTIGQGMSLLFGGMQDKRQLEHQKKLWDEEMKRNKDMAKYNSDLSFENWLRTNYPAQVDQMKKAGLSISGMYEGGGNAGMAFGGTGSGPSGASAGDPNAGMAIGANMAMLEAQKKNIEAQTKKTEVETQNMSDGGVTNEATKWATDLSKKLMTDEHISAIHQSAAQDTAKKEVENERLGAEWEAFKEANFSKTKDGEGWIWNDPNSPIVKAYKAGADKTLIELQKAKTENNIAKAEETIKNFEANLTKQGIAAGSPWYVKMVGDLLKKVGINLTGDTAEVGKIIGKEAKKANLK